MGQKLDEIIKQTNKKFGEDNDLQGQLFVLYFYLDVEV